LTQEIVQIFEPLKVRTSSDKCAFIVQKWEKNDRTQFLDAVTEGVSNKKNKFEQVLKLVQTYFWLYKKLKISSLKDYPTFLFPQKFHHKVSSLPLQS
jgi:hypothetical protein